MPRQSYSSPELVPTSLSVEHPFKRGTFLPVRRSTLRWPGVDYTAKGCVCFVTYNLKDKDVLLTGEVAQTAWQALLKQRHRDGFILHAACLMPDHVHLLVSPTGTGESVSDIVSGIKRSQFHAVRNALQKYLRWHTSFYDHVLRGWQNDRDEFDSIVWYIRNNPINSGLAANPTEYPFVL